MGDMVDLYLRLTRAMADGTGIYLSHADLLLMKECGAFAAIEEACAFARNPRDFPRIEPSAYCEDCSPKIYFIQAGDAGPVKIGLAMNPEQRRTELQTASHERLHIRATVVGDLGTEQGFHRFYRREHVRGEWFRPSLRLKAFVEHLGGVNG